MNKPLLISLFLGVCFQASAQRDEQFNRIPQLVLNWRHSVQQKDYLMGFDLGATNRSRNLIGQVVFDFRPYARKVQEFIGNSTFYQYAEKRYVVGAGMEYLQAFQQSNKGVFIGINGVYNFGEYRGLSYRPAQGWSVLPSRDVFEYD